MERSPVLHVGRLTDRDLDEIAVERLHHPRRGTKLKSTLRTASRASPHRVTLRAFLRLPGFVTCCRTTAKGKTICTTKADEREVSERAGRRPHLLTARPATRALGAATSDVDLFG